MKDKKYVKFGDRVRYLNTDYEEDGEPSRHMASGVVEKYTKGIPIKFDSDGAVLYAMEDEWEYYDESSPVGEGKALSTLVVQMTPENSHPDAFAEQHSTSMVVSPKHYVLFPDLGIEVRHVNEAWMNKIDDEGQYISHHEASWLVQATQYILRSPFKDSLEQDLEKAIFSLQLARDSIKARKASKESSK